MLLLMGGSLVWFSGGGDACKTCSHDACDGVALGVYAYACAV